MAILILLRLWIDTIEILKTKLQGLVLFFEAKVERQHLKKLRSVIFYVPSATDLPTRLVLRMPGCDLKSLLSLRDMVEGSGDCRHMTSLILTTRRTGVRQIVVLNDRILATIMVKFDRHGKVW